MNDDGNIKGINFEKKSMAPPPALILQHLRFLIFSVGNLQECQVLTFYNY